MVEIEGPTGQSSRPDRHDIRRRTGPLEVVAVLCSVLLIGLGLLALAMAVEGDRTSLAIIWLFLLPGVLLFPATIAFLRRRVGFPNNGFAHALAVAGAAIVGFTIFAVNMPPMPATGPRNARAADAPSTAPPPLKAAPTITEPSGPPATAPPTAPSPWAYDDRHDAMRGTTMRLAWVASDTHPTFDFPYAGGSTLTLQLRHRGASDDVMLFLDRGQFICQPFGEGHVSVKFDDGPVQRFGCGEASDGRATVIFLMPAGRFISQLRKAHRVIIEAEFYQSGSHQITFQTAGLKW